MFPKLLLLFIALPLLELAILVKLGEVIGFWPTIGLVVITGILGASLAWAQGFMIYTRIQSELAAGRIPTGELVDGLLILIGGIVLLTPGLLTDLFGFALLIPWIRVLFKQWLQRKFSGMVQRGQTGIFYDNMDSSRRDFD
jgi:UPF0716 protein FxsA